MKLKNIYIKKCFKSFLKEDAKMNTILSIHRNVMITLLFFCLTIAHFAMAAPAFSEGRERALVSGPLSFTIRGGGQGDSATVGLDARMDYLNSILNIHIFGTYDLLDAGKGIGEIDNQRYGAGLALSHTFPGMANIFAGTAFINEMSEYFGHAYLGGKIKVTDFALISGSYGFGFGHEKEIVINGTSRYLLAESADWAKLGVVLAAQNGLKANLYYYLTDPGDKNISGIEGEVSYAVTDSVTIGINGSSDLTTKTDMEKNWKSYLFLTYAFGQQKGSPIDVALDKNNPTVYPMVIRTNKTKTTTTAASTLTISPASASATSTLCFGGSNSTVTFTASGGTQPYSWSTSSGGSTNLTVINATQAQWQDNANNFCDSSGTVTVTVTDSTVASATAVITVN